MLQQTEPKEQATMRKNVRQVFEAWTASKAKDMDSISTDGKSIFSYRTCLMTLAADGQAVLNMTNYSRTTSSQQAALRQLLNGQYIAVDGMPRGITAEQLQEGAK